MEQPSHHEHILLALVHINECIAGIDLDEAFRLAAFESRITQYGNACSQRSILLRIQSDLKALALSHRTPSVVDSTEGNRGVFSLYQGQPTGVGQASA